MEIEIWKDVPGYAGYMVSNSGFVKSIIGKEERLLKFTKNNSYYNVSLYRDKRIKTMRVHKLVAMAFLGHIPNGNTIVVDHVNGDRLDNRVENLRLMSHEENSRIRRNTKNRLIGAWYDPKSEKWESRLSRNGKKIFLGRFNTEIEAHDAYKRAKGYG